MTSIKHNFTYMTSGENPLWGVLVEANEATSHIFGYGIMLLIYIVGAYVIMRRTNDIAKSMIMSLHIVVLLSLILYYAGLQAGQHFFSDLFILVLLVVEAFSIAGVYFYRRENS